MTIKARLCIISLCFGILPILVISAVAGKQGLGASPVFYEALAIGLMVAVLAGLFSPGFIMQWFVSNQVKKMKEFCQEVKLGHYDAMLDVPNDCCGGGNELVDLMRDMNWMVHRIKVNESELRKAVTDLKRSRTEIQAQKLALEEVNAEQLVVQQQLEGRTWELKEAADKVRNLLDNAGQGFLSFGQDLKVAGEYSAECVMIFNQEIQERYLRAVGFKPCGFRAARTRVEISRTAG